MYRGRVKTADSANIVRDSTVIGDVTVGENSTVLFYAVLRGDAEKIVIGNSSNIRTTVRSMQTGDSLQHWETMSRSGIML